MKFKDIKDLTKDELFKKERELKDELFQAEMKNALGQLSSPISIRKTRRDIARVKTALTSKQAQ